MFFKKAFTLTELVLVFGIIAILLSFVYFNLFGSQHRVTLDSTVDVLINDLKNQQNKAVTGSIENRSSYDAYGVFFQSDKYILFHGPNFNADNPDNFSTNLNEGTTFSPINLPDSQIVFASFSGEIASFNPSQNTVTILDSYTGQQKVITINRYGVITNIN